GAREAGGMAECNGHGRAEYDGAPERFRREAGEPAVDGAMGVDEAHPALADEPAQADERADVGRSPHPDRLDWNGCGARLAKEQAIGLARDQGVPAVADQPAGPGGGPGIPAA